MASDTTSEYLVISRGQWDADASRDDVQTAIDAFYVWLGGLVAEGKARHGQRLSREGATVGRKRLLTDGPFGESKEVVGGYWFVFARDLDAAAALMADSPCLEYGLFYEIRGIEHARASAFALTNETPDAR